MTRDKVQHVLMDAREDSVKREGLYHLWLEEQISDKKQSEFMAAIHGSAEMATVDEVDEEIEEIANTVKVEADSDDQGEALEVAGLPA